MIKNPAKSIPVSWTDFPWQADQFATISDRSTATSTLPGDAAIERRLDWPTGTIAVLRHAFAAKLPRSVGWSVRTNSTISAAVAAAAAVYKRGVAAKISKAPIGPPRRKRGVYPVIFTTHVTPAQLRNHFVVIDHGVARRFPDVAKLATLILRCNESRKNLATVAKVVRAAQGSDTPPQWVAIGGGILTDVVGFAASVTGARCIYVPTTLLAMVDAAVGGKTGVNFPPYGKNQIGRFHFPEQVIVAREFLTTLPARHIRSGLAECFKHAILKGDAAFTAKLAAAAAIIDKTRNYIPLHEILSDLIRVKVDIVRVDPLERGRRAVLNFGHTLAHALEVLPGTKIEHGEAVAVGMTFAIGLGARKGLTPQKYAKLLLALLDNAKLSPKLPKALAKALKTKSPTRLGQDLWALVSHDKKNRASDRLHSAQFVLLKGPGKVFQPHRGVYTTTVTRAEFMATWNADIVPQLGKDNPKYHPKAHT